MMSSENIPPPSHPPDHHHNHNTTTRKQPPKQELEQPPPPALRCPRCDSSNTKFCYYNNYSLTQPRHFCKTCRRYWTKGGALRNVPIGGGCRKTKKHKPSPSSSSCPTPSSTSAASEFRFMAPPPSMDFNLGGISLPKLHPATAGVFTHFISTSGAHQSLPPPPLPLGMGSTTTGNCFSLDLLGVSTNYAPVPSSGNSPSSNPSTLTLAGGGGGGGGGDHTLTISSIESLSTINQEMHWKLQQQRLALIYGPSSIVNQNDNNNNNNNHHQLQEKTLLGGEGIELFKNMESNRKQLDVVGPTEWLFDQIHQTNSSTVNYGVNDLNNNNNNASNVVGVTTTSNNQHEDHFNNGVWTTELHHQQHHYNGMQ